MKEITNEELEVIKTALHTSIDDFKDTLLLQFEENELTDALSKQIEIYNSVYQKIVEKLE